MSDVGAKPPVELLQESRAPRAAAIGAVATAGFLWMVLQAVGVKAVGFAGQIFLTHLLTPEDYGVVGMACALASLPSLLQSIGTTEILVQRQRQFRRWANALFWMSLALGIAAMVLNLLLAPCVGLFKGNRQVAEALAVLSLGPLVGSFAAVPLARLQIDLKFRFIASFGFISAVVSTVLTIALAWWGFGPYSLLLPLIFMSLVRSVVFWVYAPPPIRPRLDMKRWKYLAGDRMYLLISAVAAVVIQQGDNLTLGALRGKEVLGIYFFAYNLSFQTTVLISNNLASVLFPSLATLVGEPERLAAGFFRSMRLLAGVGIPLCVVQAALAEPVFHLLPIKAIYYDSIPVVQILSVGMAFQVVSAPCIGLLQAMGKFRLAMNWLVMNAVLFLAMVWLGASMRTGMDAASYVAGAVTLFFLWIGPATLGLAMWAVGLKLSRMLLVYAAPCLASLLAAGAVWAVGRYAAFGLYRDWIHLILGGIAMIAVYAGAVWVMDRALAREIIETIARVMQRRKRGATAA